jgi:DNA-binding NarL/FixJ family response regulator
MRTVRMGRFAYLLVGMPETLVGLELTRRQAEVLQLLWRGSTNADIARTLSISEHTVRHHLEDIYRRLGVKSRVGAAYIVTQALAGSRELE